MFMRNKSSEQSMLLRIAHIALLTTATAVVCLCQTATPQANIIIGQRSDSPALPSYVVYRHFLAWVNQVDKETADPSSHENAKFADRF